MSLSRQTEEAADAIRQIGPQGIHWLLKWMRYETPAWRAEISSRLKHILEKINARWDISLEDGKASRAASASSAFKALGPKAESAVPELKRMLNEAQRPNITDRAAHALSGIGTAGLPSLIGALNNTTNFHVTFQAAHYIGRMGAEARPAVPDLVRCLKRKSPMLVQGAARALSRLQLEPDLVVPALTETLQSKDQSCRLLAAGSLGQFGSNATSAVPALVQLLADPDRSMSTAATNALRAIDPLEALRRRD